MKLTVSLAYVLLCCLVPGSAGALDSPPTAFTYQGFLASDGMAFNGLVDLEIGLFDAELGGTQLGISQLFFAHQVTNGRFAVVLDFGDQYTGTPVWLEILVRPAGVGSFLTLGSRQRLRAVPHAAFADSAWEADLALSSAAVEGKTAADLLDWNQMNGIPPELSDGDDDTAGALSCGTDQLARWDGSAWSCDDDAGVVFSRTMVVGPVGSPAANGVALLAAMSALPTPVSAEVAWVLKLEAGHYDLGAQSLEMKEWIDIEGSGQSATWVTGSVCSPTTSLQGLIEMASDTELRRLSVENSCADSSSLNIAVLIYEDRTRLTEVVARSIGAAWGTTGVQISATDVVLQSVRAVAEAATDMNIGVTVDSAVSLEMDHVSAEAIGGALAAMGAHIQGYSVAVNSCRFAASGTAIIQALALRLENGGDFSVVDSTVDGEIEADFYAIGVARLTRVEASGMRFFELGSGPSRVYFSDLESHGVAYGAVISGSGLEAWIDGSEISGGTASVGDQSTSAIIHITNSRLLGPTSLTSASSTCSAITDGTPSFYASSCP